MLTNIRPVYKGTGARHEAMVRRSIYERLYKCVVHYWCTFADRWRSILGDRTYPPEAKRKSIELRCTDVMQLTPILAASVPRRTVWG